MASALRLVSSILAVRCGNEEYYRTLVIMILIDTFLLFPARVLLFPFPPLSRSTFLTDNERWLWCERGEIVVFLLSLLNRLCFPFAW